MPLLFWHLLYTGDTRIVFFELDGEITDYEVDSMIKPKMLGHLVIRVRDAKRSEDFYHDVLGL